jgi:hypothetical protein
MAERIVEPGGAADAPSTEAEFESRVSEGRARIQLYYR